MFYIPKEWLKNVNNEYLVYDILNKFIYSEINIDIDSAINELKNIGETVVIQKLEDGTLKVD